jgi:hypothetical protein
MAYMSQEKKKVIATALKVALKSFPTLKYTLAVQNHSTLVVTIKSGPESLDVEKKGYKQVNEYYIDNHFQGESATILKAIKAASDSLNHNRSDVQSDYFDVGHYLSIRIGDYDKSFVAA